MHKHYHVLSGFRGYVPDRNEPHRTRRDAERDAVNWANVIREDGGKVVGSARGGWLTVLNPGEAGVEYIEISTCDQVECEEDLEA